MADGLPCWGAFRFRSGPTGRLGVESSSGSEGFGGVRSGLGPASLSLGRALGAPRTGSIVAASPPRPNPKPSPRRWTSAARSRRSARLVGWSSFFPSKRCSFFSLLSWFDRNRGEPSPREPSPQASPWLALGARGRGGRSPSCVAREERGPFVHGSRHRRGMAAHPSPLPPAFSKAGRWLCTRLPSGTPAANETWPSGDARGHHARSTSFEKRRRSSNCTVSSAEASLSRDVATGPRAPGLVTSRSPVDPGRVALRAQRLPSLARLATSTARLESTTGSRAPYTTRPRRSASGARTRPRVRLSGSGCGRCARRA